MNRTRRSRVAGVLAATLAASLWMLAGPLTAQTYPARTIRIVSPFSAGSGVDAIARVYAQRLAEQMQVAVVVENREGAGGMVGAGYVAKLPGDGYTLLVATTPFVVGPISQGNAAYDPVRDFTGVGRVAINPLLLAINADLPARTVKELVAYGRANPTVLTYASSGPGTPSQLEMEVLKARLGVEIREIPYRSNAQALTDTIAGTVSMYYTVQTTTLGNVRAGRLRALAVASARPTLALPEVPTMAEAAGLPGYESMIWYGFVAPAATPAALVQRLGGEVGRATQAPEIAEAIRKLGFEVAAGTSAEFGAQIVKEAERWTALVGKKEASK